MMGGPGLFTVAFLDSSFVSLPQINDILVVLMVIEHKERMLYYAAMATAGSVAGCLAIYYIAEKGGEAFLRKRLKAGHVDRALALYRRHGVLALMVPALLPPPAPFKLFVLAAGVAEVRPWQFVWAIARAPEGQISGPRHSRDLLRRDRAGVDARTRQGGRALADRVHSCGGCAVVASHQRQTRARAADIP